MKNKNKKETLNDRILEFLEAQLSKPAASLPHFEQLSFFEHLNLSSLSKVMAV